MATKKLIKRKYHFSDTILTDLAGKVYRAALVDILKFNNYGVTDTDLENFKNQRDDFREDDGDVNSVGIWMTATEEKDALSEKLLDSIRTVRTMAGNKWGVSDAKYRCYGFENMTLIPDEKLHRLGKRVVKTATTQLADLSSEGLTIDIINDLAALNSDFDEAIDTKEQAEINRDIATQERIKAGNSLYKELMRLCKIGQDIFTSSNYVRAKIYTIYNRENVKVEKKKKKTEEDKQE